MLTCIHEHVSAVIIESYEIETFYQFVKAFCVKFVKYPWHGIYKDPCQKKDAKTTLIKQTETLPRNYQPSAT